MKLKLGTITGTDGRKKQLFGWGETREILHEEDY